jgi:hypothetical protein
MSSPSLRPGAPRCSAQAPAPRPPTGLEVVPLDRIEGAISDALGRIFGLFDALAAVAVLIAALGIVNTLTMNVIERVREIGILRAAGMTRGQVWRSVVVEAGVLGLAGALLGIALGLVVGALIPAGGRLAARGCPGRSSAGACLASSWLCSRRLSGPPGEPAAMCGLSNTVTRCWTRGAGAVPGSHQSR